MLFLAFPLSDVSRVGAADGKQYVIMSGAEVERLAVG
jgi:hypothetical protein